MLQGNLCDAATVSNACEGVSAIIAMVGPPAGSPGALLYPNYETLNPSSFGSSCTLIIWISHLYATFCAPIIKPSTRHLFAVAPAGQSEFLIAIRNIVAGLRKHGVKRFIVQMGAFTKLEGELSFGQKAMRKVHFLFIFPGIRTII
jgi:hypothetical protein